MPIASDVWTILIPAVVTIVTTVSAVAIAWINLKGKLAENTKLTLEASRKQDKTHAEIVETKTAMIETKAAAKTAVISNRAAVEELKAAKEQLQSLLSNGAKKPDGGNAG